MQGSVRKRSKTWSYYFDIGKVQGKRKRKEKGGFKTKAEAQEALRQALYEYEHSGRTFSESNISVSDYFDKWFQEYALLNCKFNTQILYKKMIKNHIKTAIGNYKLKSISPSIIQELINTKYNNNMSRSSISTILGILSNGFNMAVYPYKLIKESPIKNIILPRNKDTTPPSEDAKIITQEVFNKILRRFPEKSSFYIPLQIAFYTGMRRGEVCALSWDDIDLENKTINVRYTLVCKGQGVFELGSPKTKSSNRTIIVGKTLIDILKKHKLEQIKNKSFYGDKYIDSNFVCTKKTGAHVTTETLGYLARVVSSEIHPGFTFHMLRHTHATMLLEAGANIKDIQKRLGHSKLSTTIDTYSHVTKTMEQNTVDIFERIVKNNV